MRPWIRIARTRGRALALIASVACTTAACTSTTPAFPEVDATQVEPGPDADTTADAAADAGGGRCVRGVLPTCPTTPPSYAQTVAPIFRRACVACHYPGTTIARGDFTTYAGIKQEPGSVLDQVYGCAMPPADGGTVFSSQDRTEMLTWLVCGSPNN